MYKLVLSNDAHNDLHQIIVFIASETKSNEVALTYLDKLEKAILTLEEFPLRGTNPRYKILRNQGFKFLFVERHLVFYKVNKEKNIVTVYRVLHQKSSYQNFL